MHKRIFFISLILFISILSAPVGVARAARALQAGPPTQGAVQSITLDNDVSTGITIVIVVLRGSHELETVRLSQETAIRLGFVVLDGDGKPGINGLMLGKHAKVETSDVLPPTDRKRHPVGDALATFFSGIEGLDYDAIMEAHEGGMGFGMIAQVLWLMQELPEADVHDFQVLLDARKNNTYVHLTFVDDSGATITPSNWAELRKAILAGKPVGNLGTTLSEKGGNPAENVRESKPNDRDKGQDKDKERERDNNGRGNGSNP